MRRTKTVSLRDLGNVACQSRSYARFAYDEIFRKREYAQYGIELNPGDVIFDVGANIGLFSLFANRECQSDVTIFAFEPIPETYDLLQRNAESHALTKRGNIRLFNMGLTRSGGPQRASFAYYPSASGLSTMKPDELEQIVKGMRVDNVIKTLRDSNPLLYVLALPLYPIRGFLVRRIRQIRMRRQEVNCELTTLSDVLRKHALTRVDLLKIDVEGAELDVLDGIEEEHWSKVRQIVVEVHDVNGRLDTVRRLLEKSGFGVIQADLQEWSRGSVPGTFLVYARR